MKIEAPEDVVATAERAVMQALALAPDDVEARLAAYRFHFYNHRLAEALPHAAGIVVQMARRLNVATDWRLVRPEDAAFSDLEEAPGALSGLNSCLARPGSCVLAAQPPS